MGLTPAFSTPAIMPVPHFPLPHFQSPLWHMYVCPSVCRSVCPIYCKWRSKCSTAIFLLPYYTLTLKGHGQGHENDDIVFLAVTPAHISLTWSLIYGIFIATMWWWIKLYILANLLQIKTTTFQFLGWIYIFIRQMAATTRFFSDFCRLMLCISAAYVVMRCPSVCPSVRPSVCLSVTFVYSVETNKHVFRIIFTVG